MQQTLFERQTVAEPPSSGVQVDPLVSKPLLLHGDCRKFLFDGTIEPDSIDLTVTSPPYDNLMTYNNSSSWGWPEFSAIAAGLWRVTKPGGVVVWVVGDATIKGCETGASFEQALAFKKIGFNLHDTMIWHKVAVAAYDPRNKRYKQSFEYVLVLSKGCPATYNPIKDKPTKKNGVKGKTSRKVDGSIRKHPDVLFGDFQDRHNVWDCDTGYMRASKDKIAFDHPAIFPEQLAHDHIVSWSNEGDTVFDPFLGSGTTGKMAKLLNRKFIGIEIDLEYYQIATKRIEAC